MAITAAMLTNVTQDQLFFVANANTMCSGMTTVLTKHDVRTGEHAPDRYRVNVPLSNSKHFARAFNCRPEAPMNPKNKCEMW